MLVIITDAHAIFRDGIEIALNEAYPEKCDILHCDTYDQLQRSLKNTRYDLVVVGSNSLPNKSSLTFRKLRQISGESPIVISVDEPSDLASLRENGLDGVIEKSAPLNSHVKLFEVITSAVKSHSSTPRKMTPSKHKLTPKQQKIWELMAKGLSNREIAEELNLSEGTVKVHATSIFKRLSVRNRTEATLLAYDLFHQ